MAVTGINDLVAKAPKKRKQNITEAKPVQIKGLEKTTKITNEYLIWNGMPIFIKEANPYFTVITTGGHITFGNPGPPIHEKNSTHVYLNTPEADKYMSRSNQNMLIELAGATKKALNDKKPFYFPNSEDGKFAQGVEIIIGGNEYIASYRGAPVQYDGSRFYYTYKNKVKVDGMAEVIDQKYFLSENETKNIVYIDSRDSQVVRSIASLNSRSGRAQATQKLETLKDKAQGKNVMGYVDVYASNAYTFVEHDEKGYFYILNNIFTKSKRIDLSSNQVKTYPVYWDAEKKEYYYNDIRGGGFWTLRRTVPERFRRDNEKI